MNLDEGARDWLTDIEALHNRLFYLQAEHDKLHRSKARARTTRAQDKHASALEDARRNLMALNDEVSRETARFFERVLGITKDALVVCRELNGALSSPLIVNTMAARLLSDNTAAYAVSGDSLTENLTNGLPRNDYLMVREAKGQSLRLHT